MERTNTEGRCSLPDEVDGYMYVGPDSADDEIVELVARVSDRRVLDDIGPAFFIKHKNGEVGIATATMLHPWFAL